ncbi:MAG: aminotransferase class I/II-fold pyridoxal phosphate-dependent enzyme [Lachnospiraceae bacterium]|nr:aminotransferase class I/II-fold pyridoxal phosphate-dependent enzyme [Lachnospiraceae bacterium]
MGIHGGDLYRNHVNLDFSININPLGVPQSVKEAMYQAIETCNRYPDIMAEHLTNSVSSAYDVPAEYLLFGNGSSELFMAVVHGITPKKTVIPVPSFYGYEYAARASDGEIVYYKMTPENKFCLTSSLFSILSQDVELLFIANPNNPTGNVIEKEIIKKILDYCKKRKIYVVLDECFVEFCDGDYSMLPDIEAYENLILVRAFTKIFSIPGVRLGYLVCSNQNVMQKIKRHIPEWNLSCFAQVAGCACCAFAEQTDFIKNTVEYINKERQFLEDAFRQKGFRVFHSDANFLLIFHETPLYERLLEQRILIRDCSNFRGLGKGYYRIAIKNRAENESLLKAIGEL